MATYFSGVGVVLVVGDTVVLNSTVVSVILSIRMATYLSGVGVVLVVGNTVVLSFGLPRSQAKSASTCTGSNPRITMHFDMFPGPDLNFTVEI